MNIRDLSRKYGVSMDAIRYYEKMELIGQPKRESNRRVYTDKEAKELEFILIAKEGGIPLELLKKFMVTNRDEEADVIEKKELLQEEIKYIQDNINKLKGAMNKIQVFIDRYDKVINARIQKENARIEREQSKEYKKEQARLAKEQAKEQARIEKQKAKEDAKIAREEAKNKN